ncbi:hypothetical protein ACTXT7_011507 [Hymenolepis weldensis]
MNYRQIVLAFCLLSTLAIVDAIKCYQCESHTQRGCYPLETSLVPLTDCPAGSKSCSFTKMDAQFKLEVGEEQEPKIRYIRGCSSEDSQGGYSCLERAGTGANTKNTYCRCDSDGCNPAGRVAMMGSGFVVALVLAVFYLA